MKKRLNSKKYRRRIIFLIFYIALGGILFVALVNYYILRGTEPRIFSTPDEVPASQAVMILGARVYDDGRMSDILNDRFLSALEIYKKGKASKILVSGDHGRKEYDEVNTIKNALLKKGVREEDIFLDHAGFDTYDSLYRAKDIFEVESLIVCTQEFHLPRAVYTGNALGIETYGYKADKQVYLDALRNQIRESLARMKAFLNVTFHSKPRFLGDKIPIEGDGRKSWD